jgi:chromosome segregation ATPase
MAKTDEQFERQELIMKEQDEALDDISDELKTIKYIAIKIGDEMDEHNVLLDDLKDNIDNTNSRVNAANKKIDLISRISENKYSVIIAILIIILIIMIVIYFS